MKEFEGYESDAAVAADLASKQAHLTVGHLSDGVALIDSGAKVVNLEQYEAGRMRKRGTFRTQHIESFVSYIEDEAEPENTKIFIDKDQMNAVAILNFGADEFAQGHLDNNAVLQAQQTITFKQLIQMHNEGRCKQKGFAEFLEDWGHIVIAKNSEGDVIENAKAVNAVRNMQIDESAQTNSSVENYRESRSRLESVEAKSVDGALPSYFEVTDSCYSGFEPVTVKLRLGISSVDGLPVFKLEIIGLQIIQDSFAKEFVNIVAEALSDDVYLAIGTFKG
ncbi:DUF2303 family protein [Psychrobacter sp. NPDC078370]|uniref:DUF2303 family protein n=1 Tax=unclassified Psychrobacter TaxID=196806 RepID=UPI003D016A6F